MSAPGDDLVEIRMIGLPVQLWADVQEHHDELVREFTLLTAGLDDPATDSAPVPQRLLHLLSVLDEQFAGAADPQRQQLFDAAAAGERSLDLAYRLPPAAAPAAQQLTRLLDEADEYCRQGDHLLTLASDEQHVAFRRWYVGQVVDQIAGADPVPWPGGPRAAPPAS